MKNSKMKILKTFIFILILLMMLIITIKVFPIFKNIATEEGRNTFKVNIENSGYQGVLMILGLMFTQMFFPILPGEPVELLAGMCFGTWGGLLVIYVGVFVTTLIIYFLVRKFGRDFIVTFISEEKLSKIQNSKTWSDRNKIRILLFLSFFIPGLPKDIFVYIGGLLPIKPIEFLLISTFARFPSIISSTIVGSNILYGNWIIILITYVITFSISGILLFILNRKPDIVQSIVQN
jgi:uncharacterized membrane protein YdjX (TVP38/TMEM64 family)